MHTDAGWSHPKWLKMGFVCCQGTAWRHFTKRSGPPGRELRSFFGITILHRFSVQALIAQKHRDLWAYVNAGERDMKWVALPHDQLLTSTSMYVHLDIHHRAQLRTARINSSPQSSALVRSSTQYNSWFCRTIYKHRRPIMDWIQDPQYAFKWSFLATDPLHSQKQRCDLHCTSNVNISYVVCSSTF